MSIHTLANKSIKADKQTEMEIKNEKSFYSDIAVRNILIIMLENVVTNNE